MTPVSEQVTLTPTLGTGAHGPDPGGDGFTGSSLLLPSPCSSRTPSASEPLETVPLCIDTNRIALAFTSPPELHPNY